MQRNRFATVLAPACTGPVLIRRGVGGAAHGEVASEGPLLPARVVGQARASSHGDGSDCDVADLDLLTCFSAGEPLALENGCKPELDGP